MVSSSSSTSFFIYYNEGPPENSRFLFVMVIPMATNCKCRIGTTELAGVHSQAVHESTTETFLLSPMDRKRVQSAAPDRAPKEMEKQKRTWQSSLLLSLVKEILTNHWLAYPEQADISRELCRIHSHRPYFAITQNKI
jgi:hypothetical protein